MQCSSNHKIWWKVSGLCSFRFVPVRVCVRVCQQTISVNRCWILADVERGNQATWAHPRLCGEFFLLDSFGTRSSMGGFVFFSKWKVKSPPGICFWKITNKHKLRQPASRGVSQSVGLGCLQTALYAHQDTWTWCAVAGCNFNLEVGFNYGLQNWGTKERLKNHWSGKVRLWMQVSVSRLICQLSICQFVLFVNFAFFSCIIENFHCWVT